MTQAQKTAKAKFKQAIAYRQKTGVSLKEAFAHIYGKKKVVKKAVKKSAPKKKAIKKVAKKRIAGPKDSKLIKKELAKKGLKMPHGYATIKRKRKISGVKKKPTESQVLKSIQKAVKTQKSHMSSIGSHTIDRIKDQMALLNKYQSFYDHYMKMSIKERPKLEIKKLRDLIKETKTHISQLKKHI